MMCIETRSRQESESTKGTTTIIRPETQTCARTASCRISGSNKWFDVDFETGSIVHRIEQLREDARLRLGGPQ